MAGAKIIMKDVILKIYKSINSLLPFGYALPPLFLLFVITSRCNLNCLMCSLQKERDVPFEDIQKIIDSLSDFYKTLIYRPKIMFFGGEPTVHEKFYDIIKYTALKGFKISLCTNATLLGRGKIEFLYKYNLSEIIFSLDGLENINDKIRGKGSFNKVNSAIRYLSQMDKDNRILKRTNTVLMKTNYTNLDKFISYFKEVDLEHMFEPIVVNKLSSSLQKELALSLDEFLAVEKQLEFLSRKHKRKIILKKTKDLIEKDPNDKSLLSCTALDWRLTVRDDGLIGLCYRCDPVPLGVSFWKSYNSKVMRENREQLRKRGYLEQCGDCCHLTRSVVYNYK